MNGAFVWLYARLVIYLHKIFFLNIRINAICKGYVIDNNNAENLGWIKYSLWKFSCNIGIYLKLREETGYSKIFVWVYSI